MRKIVILTIIILCFITTQKVYSQQGYKAIYTVGGLTYEHGGNVIIGIDFPNSFYSSMEIYGQYYKYKDETNIYAGLSYKPCLYKGINSLFRGKLSGAVGTTTHKYTFAPVVGFEWIYSVSPTVDFMWLNDGGYYHNTTERWRVNTYIGLRLNF